MTVVFELSQVSVRYAAHPALALVSLSAGAGEILGLLGPNGARIVDVGAQPVSYTHLTLPTILLV